MDRFIAMIVTGRVISDALGVMVPDVRTALHAMEGDMQNVSVVTARERKGATLAMDMVMISTGSNACGVGGEAIRIAPSAVELAEEIVFHVMGEGPRIACGVGGEVIRIVKTAMEKALWIATAATDMAS